MSYTNRKFNWDLDALKRFYNNYVIKWINSAMAWTDAQVARARANVGGTVDVSVLNAVQGTPATYESLTAALEAVPQVYKRGGMSVKFIQGSAPSSDNKYVQYRLMSNTFNTTVANWQGVDDEPTTGSENLVKSGGVKELFDSQYGNSILDLTISDNNNNNIVGFSGGHIKTKNFDSSLDATAGSRGLMSATDKVKLDADNEKLETIERGAEVNEVNTNDIANIDCSIEDESSNAIVIFSEGHIKTKNFDSSENANTTTRGLMSASDKTKLDGIEAGAEKNDIETSDNSAYDAAISDDNDNLIAMFKDGHIKTKKFDSEEITTDEIGNLDFAVSDTDGNLIIGTRNGYPVTKNFDGKQIADDVSSNTNNIAEIKTSISSIPTIDSVYGWEELNPSNPLAKIRFDAGLTPVIQHWGFIGDSLSSGCHGYDIPSGQTGIDIYDYSWGQFICRLCGTDGYNFSYGGGSAKTWLTNQNRGWPVAQLEQNFKQAYTIALGINDSSLLDTLYSDGIGDADTDLVIDSSNPYDYSNNNEDTFVGCYGGIIQRLRSVNPRCRIFVLTMLDKDFNHSVHLQMDAEIRKIAAKFENVYVIDLATYAPKYYNSPLHDTLVYWSHLTSVGYVWLAYLINTYIDWIIRNNLYAFRDIAFIGTDKYMDSSVH